MITRCTLCAVWEGRVCLLYAKGYMNTARIFTVAFFQTELRNRKLPVLDANNDYTPTQTIV